MKDLRKLEQLQLITAAKHQQQQQSYRRLMEQENNLRAALRKLDLHAAEAVKGAPDLSHQSLGLTTLWHAWVGKQKTQLNMQLSQVLSIKEFHLKQVRHSFGREEVATRLVAQERKNIKQRAAAAQFERISSIAVMPAKDQ
ncbi:hypothetical protein [Sulfitobacter sp. S190]|uniref:hypothetical protein n=1 Tax=Sulfitobacter sp. S190 TaxID=2867022 RepID=UPI0021A35966|nr:hypothetical protein [Sulfitobacter sp. S190]UWR22367.1 hypothetical protein K3756_17160 [Sulfitobacter sp. S190]